MLDPQYDCATKKTKTAETAFAKLETIKSG